MNFTILGIDPGTVNTGYGLIHVAEDNIKCLDFGVISATEKSFHLRLKVMHQEITNLCSTYKPDHMAIEKVFLGKNPEIAFKLGHIFALCLLESQNHGIEFFEYASRFVKKSVTFSGRSSKEMVQKFVTNFFSLEQTGLLDATDALAVALCHSREYKKPSIQKQINDVIL